MNTPLPLPSWAQPFKRDEVDPLESFRRRRDPLERIKDSADAIRESNQVNPLEKAKVTDRRETIIDVYATSQEVENVKATVAEVKVAEDVVAKIRIVLRDVSNRLSATSAYARQNGYDPEAAAAAVLGEPPKAPPQPIGGDPPSLLAAQKEGLTARLKRAEEVLAQKKGVFQTVVNALMHTCARRCAEDYNETAKKLAWHWVNLLVASDLVTSGGIVDRPTWDKLMIPGSEHLAVLKRFSQDEFGSATRFSANRLHTQIQPYRDAYRDCGIELWGSMPLMK